MLFRVIFRDGYACEEYTTLLGLYLLSTKYILLVRFVAPLWFGQFSIVYRVHYLFQFVHVWS